MLLTGCEPMSGIPGLSLHCLLWFDLYGPAVACATVILVRCLGGDNLFSLDDQSSLAHKGSGQVFAAGSNTEGS
jgi:hypothetical protein